MGKDLGKSRPDGLPPAPHPYSRKDKSLESDIMATHKEDVILTRLGGEIKSVRLEIELNYKRVHYSNPMVEPLLELIEEQMRSMEKMLGVPEDFYMKEKSKGMSFGMTSEDIK